VKILIAYDGSQGAGAALEGLARAGLPSSAEAMVLTVADAPVTLAGRAPSLFAANEEDSPPARLHAQAAAALHHAHTVAADAAARLRKRFPGWTVSPDAWGGSPASAIVLKADVWQPDLVVVGSRSRARPSKLLLGSVARKVVTEARCAVRVGRGPAGDPHGPLRILVGHDGGGGGRAALAAAAARAWPAGSEIRIVAVQGAELYPAFDPETVTETWPPAEMPADRSVLQRMLDEDVARARRPDLTVSAQIATGLATAVLLRAASRWKADCIFVGATSRGRAARFLLGSVSAAVADRARCSVEVVRACAAAG
jgi:nucleotide-binding universal stress UspA family protein